jgi:hypothetical protein
MAAYWNLTCPTCIRTDFDVECSMYDIPPCPTCSQPRYLAPAGTLRKSGIFPFTLNHVTGSPMEIRDMTHLRQVERDYGVAFSAFNKASIHDLDPLKDVPTFREHGRHHRDSD